jgi:hypothetical protein
MVDLTDWIEIFRAGKYPQGSYTEDDVNEMATKYDPNIHEAPIILDHNDVGPAYGWVEQLQARGSVLYAKFKQVSNALKELVTTGAYKKRSVEIYPKFEATGSSYLRAVSFVTVPQVKGLQPAFSDTIRFSDTKGDYAVVGFNDETKKDNPIKQTSNEGSEMDDKRVQELIDSKIASFDDKIKVMESRHAAESEKYEAEINALKEQNKNALTKLSEAERVQKSVEINSFCEQMKRELRLTPAMEAFAKPLMTALTEISGTVKFSENDKEVEATPFVK